MQNIKKICLRVLTLVLAIVIIENTFILVCATKRKAQYKIFTDCMLKDLYNTEENIDLVLIGPSTFQRAMNPQIFTKELGLKTFSASTAGQSMMDTYYILREVVRISKPKYAVIELSSSRLSGQSANLTSSAVLVDGFRLSKNKLVFMSDAFNIEDALDLLFFTHLQRDDIVDETVGKIAAKIPSAKVAPTSSLKITATKNPEPQMRYSKTTYLGDGYLYVPQNITDTVALDSVASGYATEVDEESYAYLEKTVAFCRENDILPVFVSCVRPDSTLMAISNYSNMHNVMQYSADKLGVPLFDLSLAKDSFLNPDNLTWFEDRIHLNALGGDNCSYALAKLLKEYYENHNFDVSEYIYPTYDEWARSITEVTDVWCNYECNGNNVNFTGRAYSGTETSIEYQYLIGDRAEGEFSVLREYETEPLYTFEYTEPCYVQLRARCVGTGTVKSYTVYITDN